MTDPVLLIFAWIKRSWRWLGPVMIFLFSAILLTSLQFNHVFSDPDSFYHVKMALKIAAAGPVWNFPWLAFTAFPERFVDQHFLYHVALIPFVTLMPPLTGAKVATILFGSLFALAFYLLLRSFRSRLAFGLTLLLMAINPFTFRLSLTKAPGVSLIFLLGALAALFHYKPRWLAAITFVYVWFYGGAYIALIAAGIFIVVSFVRHLVDSRRDDNHVLHRLFSLAERNHWRERRMLLWRLAGAVTGGFVLGTVINPYFPKNISFLADQLVRIGIVNYQKVIGVGGEWYPYALGDLIPNTVILSILLVIAIVLGAVQIRRLSVRSWTMFLFTAFLFILTLKSRRYIEYYVPMGMLFVGFVLTDVLQGVKLKKVWSDFWVWALESTAKLTLATVLVLYVAAALITIVSRDYITERGDLNRGFAFTEYQSAMTWLAKNSPEGALVIHSDWDEFPVLFYHNDHNRYVVGLDPTFFYTHDKDRYWQWVNLTTGRAKPPVLSTVRDTFGADYVFVAQDHTAMDALFRGTPDFRLVYEDSQAKIYQVAR